MTGIIMVTSTAAVLLACTGFVTADLINLRSRLAGDLATLAQVIGSNSTAALTFGDRQGAQEVLSALRARPSIVAARIYSDQGKPFASYQPSARLAIPFIVAPDGFYEHSGRLELFYGIHLGRRRIGTLYIASDDRDRKALLKQYIAIAGVIVLVSLLSALLLSSKLQRSISSPIVELARVANLVSEHKDYSQRASSRDFVSDDEIAHLLYGFNGMLAEIEQRDRELLDAKSAAENLADINAQLARESALILNSATDGILGLSIDNRPTFLNPSGARILGMSLSDMEGKTFHQAVHHSHADGTPFPEEECVNTRAIRNGEAVLAEVDTFWRTDGSSFPVEYSSTPMFGEDGKQSGAVVMFRDITERSAVDRLKGEFVSTVSHELRTPLTSIRGALGLLSSGLLGAGKGQRMLEIAISNTDRLVRLINDMLDLERIGAGKVELVRRPIDAAAVMRQAADGLQSIALEAGVRIVIEPTTGALWGDSDRIIQTLTNLIGNAIKFSIPDTTVTLSGSAGETEFSFCVADEGRGIPREKLTTIFERFSQVDASDSRDKGGSGLGLAICESIVSAHGGRIWAEANRPTGSRFQFTIPMAPEMRSHVAGSQDLDSAPSPVPAFDRPVLIVEDDLDLARVMTIALQNQLIRVIHTSTGSEVLALCAQYDPGLIILDLALPGMDGFGVVDLLRDDPNFRRTPLIIYSAFDVASADQARLRLGPTKYLTKSRCSLPELASCASGLLSAAEAPLELIRSVAL
jgi:PAS domain S-box-containing protein